MIQFTLKCDKGHQSESWFQSSAAYDQLEKAGHLTCAICGSTKVSKGLMAPRVRLSEETAVAVRDTDKPAATAPVLNAPSDDVERAIGDLRRKVEANSDYVGDNFVTEARAMHLGEKPERSIYGEARLDQAKALIEDGVPLMPLPFRPKQKLT